MAIGIDDGSIEIYKMPSLKRIARIMEVRQLIQCLRWHPTCTAEAVESSHRFWLAVSSNVFSICITMNGSGDAPNDLALIEDFIVESIEKSEDVAPDQERSVSIVTEISSSRKDFATKKKKKKLNHSSLFSPYLRNWIVVEKLRLSTIFCC